MIKFSENISARKKTKNAASASCTLFRLLLIMFLSAISTEYVNAEEQQIGRKDGNRIIDCLLPGQVRQLGSRVTYLSARRPARLPAVDCEIRGGEYLIYDRANAKSSMAYWIGLAESASTGSEERAAAEMRVAEIFERGLLGEPDYQQAFIWYQAAADDGGKAAMLKVASFYERGTGVERDPAKAQTIYAKVLGKLAPPVLDPRTLEAPLTNAAELREQLADEQNAKRNLRDRLAKVSAELNESRQVLKDLEKRFDLEKQNLLNAAEREEQQRTIENLKSEIARADKQVENYRARIEELSAKEKRLDQLEKELIQREQKIAELSDRIANGESELQNVQNQLAKERESYDSELADLQVAMANLKSQGAEDKKLRDALAARQHQLEEQRETIAQLKAALSTQGDQTEKYRRTLSDLEAEQAVAANLRAKIIQQQVANRALQSQYDEVNVQMAQAESRLRTQEQHVSALETRLKLLERQRDSATQSDSENRSRVAELQSAIAQQQALLREKQDAVDGLRGEIRTLREEQSQMRARDEQEKNRLLAANLAGPEIELIDPPLMKTRGIEVVSSVAAAAQLKQIIGRITAPAGVLSVTVNDLPQTLNPMGVFQTTIEVNQPKVPVRIVAVDNQGKREELVLELQEPAKREKQKEPPLPKIYFGKYYALLIGNNSYRYLPDLGTAIYDVQAIAGLLETKYGFKTTVVKNASREAVFEALYDLFKTMTSDDNLLIYYAGHGSYVEGTRRGVWLPVDARRDNPANWITNVEVSDYLSQIRAKQVLIIADSCYSGALTRSALTHLEGGMTDREYRDWLKSMAHKISRTALTSGGLKPTLDAGGGGHSVFARAVLDVLSENRQILAGQDLGQAVSARVVHSAGQLGFIQEPEYAPIDATGHEGGDFFFVPSVR